MGGGVSKIPGVPVPPSLPRSDAAPRRNPLSSTEVQECGNASHTARVSNSEQRRGAGGDDMFPVGAGETGPAQTTPAVSDSAVPTLPPLAAAQHPQDKKNHGETAATTDAAPGGTDAHTSHPAGAKKPFALPPLTPSHAENTQDHETRGSSEGTERSPAEELESRSQAAEAAADDRASNASSPSPLREDGEAQRLSSLEQTTRSASSPVAQVPAEVAATHVTGTAPVHTGAVASMTEVAAAYRSNARSVSPAMAITTDYGALPLNTLQTELRHNHRVLRVCLTGGPCAGKSTMLAEIQAKIPQRTGYQVYCVPEAATMFVMGGMKWDGRIALEQQLCLLRVQLALEDQFYALAVASGQPTIIISDRGTMDGRAFCAPEDFEEILRRLGCTLDVLRDRYDAVIHMVTAACGAEQFYSLDNPARYEDVDGARVSDRKLQQMYVGHPVFRLLDNSTPFTEKIERGLQLLCRLVGQEGAAQQRTSYFVVRRSPLPTLPVPSATFRVRTVVLSNSQMGEMRLVQERVMADGSHMHFFRALRKMMHANAQPVPPAMGDSHTAFARRGPHGHLVAGGAVGVDTRGSSAATDATQQPFPRRASTVLSAGGSASRSRSAASSSSRASNLLGQASEDQVVSAVRISSKEYACLVENRDPLREIVETETTHFIYNGTNYELTTILAPSWAAGKQTLSVEYDVTPSSGPNDDGDVHCKAAATPEIPEFVEVDREVPLDSMTTAFLISHKETGPLYTSLAFAPVFSQPYRGSVAAIGPHADVENFLHSTHSTPKRNTSLIDRLAEPPQPLPVEAEESGTKPANEEGDSTREAQVQPSATERSSLQPHGPDGEDMAHDGADTPAPLPEVPIKKGLTPLSAYNVNQAVAADKPLTAKEKMRLTKLHAPKSHKGADGGASSGGSGEKRGTISEGSAGASEATPVTARLDPAAVAAFDH